MAVKEGLPATDFSKMNRDYIRNVAEGETVKDGLPATDFSRMNREYIKAVVEEAGGGGGGGGGGDESPFSSVPVTLVIGSGLGSVEYNGSMNYPEPNPNSSNDFPYTGTYVVGDTQSETPEELENEITFYLPTYNGVGYLGSNFSGSHTSGDQFNSASVSLSGDAVIDTDPPTDYFNEMIKITGECTITITWET